MVPLATAFGVLAAAVQFLGLIRWPYLVPYLARTFFDPSSSEATRDAVAVVFQAFHRYAGVAIGEHLGYLFTGLWTLLVGVAMTQGDVFPSGWAGPASSSVWRWSLDPSSSPAPSRRPGGRLPARWCPSPTSSGRSGWWLRASPS